MASALVVGGCGCLGYHVVQRLLNDPTFASVHVLDIRIHSERHWSRQAGAIYHQVDILSKETVSPLLSQLNPLVVVHTASPPSVGTKEAERRMFNTNVAGTRNLLQSEAKTQCRAFVYTSSVGVLDGTSFNFASEDHPIKTMRSWGSLYGKSKALAEQMTSNGTMK